jgi:heme-degrading monooxygenase HmoA
MTAIRPGAAACPHSSEPRTAPPDTHPDAQAPTFVALSRFTIANGMTAEVKAAFRNRPHLVDGVPGYLRMDVISPLELPEEIWLITVWTDEASFRTWHHSHNYRGSHAGIPKGLKLVPGQTQIRLFEYVAS